MINSLVDQLVAAGFAPASSSPPPVQPPNGLVSRALPARLLCQLPLWGMVTSWREDQGFGFLKCRTEPGDIFFHITARQPRQPVDTNTLPIGEPILFILGPDTHKPDKLCAVR